MLLVAARGSAARPAARDKIGAMGDSNSRPPAKQNHTLNLASSRTPKVRQRIHPTNLRVWNPTLAVRAASTLLGAGLSTTRVGFEQLRLSVSAIRLHWGFCTKARSASAGRTP